MRAKTTDGQEFDLKQDLLDGLKMRMRGQLLFPGEPGYDDSRTVWNGMIDRRPAAVARCLGTSDVIECVKLAAANDLLLCIKSGGHNIAGLACADGGLMLDLSAMRGVWVDTRRKIAHAQGGCLLGDVDRETQLHGLAAVLGFVSLTGVAGLTLGGGFGYLTRRWGWTADNVVGMDLVTADGRVVRASSEENQDLFWGLRGGGGNFGVVTGIDYTLYPVGPEIVGGIVAWPASDAPKVLELFRSLVEDAPPELTLVALMRPAPAAPWLPKEWHGKPIVALLACYSGKPEEGEKVVVYYGAANRDARIFDDPDRFDVTRTPNEHLAFGGGGPHHCLGAHVARVEIEAMFAQLLTRLPDLEKAGDTEWLPSNFISGPKHLPVRRKRS